MTMGCNMEAVTLHRQTEIISNFNKLIMKIKSLIFALGVLSASAAFAQEAEVNPVDALNQRVTLLEDAKTVSSRLKLSGYIQSEWQSSQIDVNGNASQDMKVGAGANAGEKADAVATPGSQFSRFGVRRGRLKATYTNDGFTGVFYIDASEKGVVLKEAYVSAIDPWAGVLTLKGGVFNRPFGYEIEYSSSQRESPERSRIIQTLFPNERDLGAMITLQAPKTSPWNVVKLDLGLVAGDAIGVDTKSKKDLIAHLTYNNGTPTMKYGIGASLYNGTVFQPTNVVYNMENGYFKADSTASNKNGYAKRQYIGIDGQFSIASVAGMTSIRGEYIFGTQPGTSSSTKSPDLSVSPTGYATAPSLNTGDTYMRKFAGGYVQLVQDIADTKHSVTVKYDWYDPNTDVKGDGVGATTTAKATKATGKADIAYSTIGFGYLYRMTPNVKFMVYYDMPVNETTSKLAASGTNYTKKLDANLITVRMQYKF